MNNENFTRQAALLLIIITGLFIGWSLSSFLTSFLSAIILYVISRPLMRYFISKKRWNRNLSALLIILLSFMIVLLPIWGLTYMLSSKVYYVINHSDELITMTQTIDKIIFEKTGFSVFSTDSVEKIKVILSELVPQFLGKTLSILADIGMMYFILFFMLISTGKMEKIVEQYIPFRKASSQHFATELEMMIYSNVLGAPLLAIIQGLVAALGFWILGLNEPFFWGIMCGFFSFIPLVGTAFIWIPAGAFLIYTGHQWQGITLLIFGAIVITNIDNVFRFIIQKKFANVHPLVTVLGVIIGLKCIGLPGIVFGPLLISYFLLLIKVYKEEYFEMKE